MRTLLRAHTALTQSDSQPVVRAAGIVVEDGIIRHVGPLAALEQTGPYDAMVGDPDRHIALPGLVNAHHHCLSANKVSLRGSALETWLLRSRKRAVPPASAEEAYDHTLWGTLQCLKAGVTALVDHYHPFAAHLEDLGVPASVQAYGDAGVRVALCLACSDEHQIVYGDDEAFLQSLPSELAEALRRTMRPFDADAFFALWERLHARFDGHAAGRIRFGLAPAGPDWCSDALLRRVRATANDYGVPVQIHLLESHLQLVSAHRNHGQSAVARLAALGFFAPATSCAHGVWISQPDLQQLARTEAVVVPNPASNLMLFSGISPIGDLLDAGVRVGFGMDSRALDDNMDMLGDLRLGLLLQRRPDWQRREVTPSDMLALATRGGADALGLGTTIGRLEPGYQADVVLVDRTRLYASPYVSPHAPAADVLVQRATAADVEHVLVGGRLVVEGRRVVEIDEDVLHDRLVRSLAPTYDALADADRLSEAAEPYLADYYRAWEAEAAPLLPANYRYNTR